MEMRGNLKTAEAVKAFMFGGNATLTIKSTKTDVRYTFKIVQLKDRNTDQPVPNTFNVSLLDGSDNENNYRRIGMIHESSKFHTTKFIRSNHPDIENTPSFKAFAFLMVFLTLKGRIPNTMEIWHEGRCGRCGRKLTVPSSIQTGFGSECITKVSAGAVMANQMSSAAPVPAPEAEVIAMEAANAAGILPPPPAPQETPCAVCGDTRKSPEMRTMEGVVGLVCPKCYTKVTSLARTQGWSNPQTLAYLATAYTVDMEQPLHFLTVPFEPGT